MSSLQRKLTIKDGIALGIGSIMGSGILFLPSFSYQIAGADVLTAWVFTTLFCLPLLLIFSDMVKAVPNENGLKGFLALGLGPYLAAGVPILFLGTVGIGMPSAALIAGKYVSRFFATGTAVEAVVAVALVVVAIGANVFGIKTGSLFQRWVSFALFAVGIGLFFTTLPTALPKLGEIEPAWNWQAILAASVVAFWAYAGFENMTFMAGEFKRPQHDIIWSIALSLLLCGALYVGLTANVVALIPPERIDSIAGLYQLAEAVPGIGYTTILIVLFAVGAVVINLTSWSWGVSRLIYASAAAGSLPHYFYRLSPRNVPQRALIGMMVLFLGMIGAALAWPAWFEGGLQVVSTNFVFLYLLCLISYTVYSKALWKKLLGGVLTVLIAVTLSSSGWMVLYPMGLVGSAALRSWVTRSKGAEESA